MPQGHTPLGLIYFWGPLWGAHFLCMLEKGMLHMSVNKVEIYFLKIGFVHCKWSNIVAMQHIYLICLVIPFRATIDSSPVWLYCVTVSSTEKCHPPNGLTARVTKGGKTI